MKALTIRQPWVWAILHAGKRIENRGRKDGKEPAALTRHRGELILHASSTMTVDDHESAQAFMLERRLAATRFGDGSMPTIPARRQRVGDDWLPRGVILGKCRVVGSIANLPTARGGAGPVLSLGNLERLASEAGCHSALCDRTVHAVTRRELLLAQAIDLRWWTGGFGLVLDEVVEATNMVLCSGRQGLWDVPADVLAKVRWAT